MAISLVIAYNRILEDTGETIKIIPKISTDITPNPEELPVISEDEEDDIHGLTEESQITDAGIGKGGRVGR